ncbi:two-component sensor histidine kinase [Actinomadura sp. CNU-125]|uniref:sensor histidine kinase n=1 Tax=Actinomadura sp. CNU-125 TaxID=1904961 RepID=UPI00095B612E|nr:HAMP domain-containing sensor histidine kinase [Actinomadura sp. CNU-125]OLT11192.1 two-component sensor histidine kinase [Actinomadura sp. CNU-125]
MRRPRLGHPLRRLSLRTRLLCLAATLVAVGLLVAGVVVGLALHGYLQDRVDERLAVTGHIAARAPEPSGSGGQQGKRTLSLLGDTVIAYLAPDGSVRRAIDTGTAPPGGGPDLPPLDTAAVMAHGGRPFTVPARYGDHPWRVIALARPGRGTFGRAPGGASAQDDAARGNAARGNAARGNDAAGSVVIAMSLEEVDRTVAKTRAISLTAGLVLLAVLTAAGWIAVRSGLRPLTRIEETAAAIAAGDLSRRVPELAGPRTEVGSLTASLNQMLAQIDAAFRGRAEAEARMRRFFADAGHELRTPLAGIKGHTDLYRMGALPTTSDIDQTMDRIAAESTRLARLVEDMLLLDRLDEAADPSGAGPGFGLALAPMDLRTLAADALRDVRALDAERAVTLTGPGGGRPGSAPALADEARLRQVVTNLVGNAVTHTPADAPIRIGVGTVGGHAVLEVADQGPGLTAEQRRRVFDRFFRVDGSRSRTAGGGSGLGLAIAHALVTAHGGRLELDAAPGAGCTFRVLLPEADE